MSRLTLDQLCNWESRYEAKLLIILQICSLPTINCETCMRV